MLALTSLEGGFYQDDYNLLVALKRGARPFYDLYRFATGVVGENHGLIASGDYPWWIAPDFKLHLIRPLASLMLAIDASLFGAQPLGYHLDSLGWYVALLIAASMFFRRTLSRPAAAIAFLVFTLRTGHTLTYAWISARHVLVAAVPSLFALLAHMRAVRERAPRWDVLALLLLLAGFAGGEVALAIVPFWVSFDLIEGRANGGVRRALVSSAPAVLASAAYLAAYSLLGGGAASTVGYLSPLTDPVGFFAASLTRIPIYLGDALLGIPSELGLLLSVPLSVALALAGAVLCALLFHRLRKERAEETARILWLVPAALLALGPGLGSVCGRALLIADLGFSALVGVLLLGALRAARAGLSTGYGRVGLASGAVVLGVCHILAPPILTIRAIATQAHRARVSLHMATTTELRAPPAKTAFLVGAPSAVTYFQTRDTIEALAPTTLSCWSPLSPTSGAHRLTRTGPRSFTLEEMDPADGYNYFFAASRVFAVGDEVEQCGAKIRIEALRDGKPSILSVETAGSLDAPDVALLGLKDGRLRRLRVPAVGEAIQLPSFGGV